MISKEEKITKLTKEMESLSCKVKQKAKMCEIKSFEQSQISNDSEELIKRDEVLELIHSQDDEILVEFEPTVASNITLSFKKN
ncbi:hypothetical protein BpHYR1_046371 [Brachionus plicatilis]|uniref:Uncharacterized protein n=1 Tax=Brachionus plicatilis TaxID=10195 RepID=A0A3M7PAR0_BRAPC|nr:hypothetical protein BpHYR1_046371 [Brachionus plicatilis]